MEKFPFDKSIPKNLALLFKDRVAKHPDVNLQAGKNKEGVFEYYTFQQVYDYVVCNKHVTCCRTYDYTISEMSLPHSKSSATACVKW